MMSYCTSPYLEQINKLICTPAPDIEVHTRKPYKTDVLPCISVTLLTPENSIINQTSKQVQLSEEN